MNKHFNRLGARTAAALASMVFAASSAWAVDPFKVQDIRVEGLQRVEPGTVFASLPVRIGDDYNDAQDAVKKYLATPFDPKEKQIAFN